MLNLQNMGQNWRQKNAELCPHKENNYILLFYILYFILLRIKKHTLYVFVKRLSKLFYLTHLSYTYYF